MAGIPNTKAQQRRSFRLSPLELLILGLIVLGVVFLANMWVQSLSSAAPQPTAPQIPNPELEKALAAIKLLKGELAGVEKQNADLVKRLQQWEKDLKSSPTGQTVPALSGRINKLEKQVKRNQAAPKLEARIKKLETQSSIKEQMEARIKALEQQNQGQIKLIDSRTTKLEQDLAGPIKAQITTETALANLDRRLREVQKFIGDGKAAKDEPRQNNQQKAQDERIKDLEARLAKGEKIGQSTLNKLQGLEAKLGKSLAGSVNQKTVQDLQGRLAKSEKLNQSLEKKLRELEAGLARQKTGAAGQGALQGLEARLARTEKLNQSLQNKLSGLEKSLDGKSTGSTVADAKLADLGGQIEDLNQQLTSLLQEVGKAQKNAEQAGRLAKSSQATSAQAAASAQRFKDLLNHAQTNALKASQAASLAQAAARQSQSMASRAQASARISQEKADKAQATAESTRITLNRSLAAMGSASLQSRMGTAPARPPVQVASVSPKTVQSPVRPRPKPLTLTKPKPRISQPRTKVVRHSVRRGETLFSISRQYNVKVGQLRKWNPGLSRKKYLLVNDVVIVYTNTIS